MSAEQEESTKLWEYVGGYLGVEEAGRMFGLLWGGGADEAKKNIRVFGKVCKEPRRTGVWVRKQVLQEFEEAGEEYKYEYSSLELVPRVLDETSPTSGVLLRLMELAEGEVKRRYGDEVCFSMALVNVYNKDEDEAEKKKDGVGRHRDEDAATWERRYGYVASFTFLGSELDAESEFKINWDYVDEASGKRRTRQVEKVGLGHGSLFVMKPGMQTVNEKGEGYTHSIVCKGKRVNVTLRCHSVGNPALMKKKGKKRSRNGSGSESEGKRAKRL